MTNTRRASDHDAKRLVCEMLLAAWQNQPELRLGQLLVNALGDVDLFYVDDFDLVE